MRTLLIGGARSGKSALAQRWAAECSHSVCVLATGASSDPEMAARIAAHRRARPAHWNVIEEPIQLAGALTTASSPREEAGQPAIVVDCLTLWIANCLWREAAPQPDLSGWHREREAFLDALRGCRAEVFIVTNELGTGIVPENAAARMFRDEHGCLNQAVATVCDRVFLVTAGLPLRLKPA